MILSAFFIIAVLNGEFVFPTQAISTTPNSSGRFLAYSLRAAEFRSLGEFGKAAAALKQAIDFSLRENLGHPYRQCLLRLAILEWNLGNTLDSRRLFAEARTAFREAEDKRSEEFSETCLALVEMYEEGKKDREAGFYRRSLARLEQARLLGRGLGISEFELKCLRQISLTYWEMGQTDMFQEFNERALKIAEVISHQAEKGRCLNNIGISYHKLSEHSLAIEYLEKALSTIRRSGDRVTEAECLSNLGIVYRDLGNSQRALFYLSGALAIDKERDDDRSVSMDLANLGTVFLGRGIDRRDRSALSQGLTALLESFSIRQKRRLPESSIDIAMLNNIGVAYNELGNQVHSRRFLHRAFESADRSNRLLERGCIINNLAASYLYEGRLEEALKLYHESYDLGLKSAATNLEIESCYGLGKCYELSLDSHKALDYYGRAIVSLEAVRQRLSSEFLLMGFSRNKLAPYHDVLRLLAELYRNKPSIELVQQMFNFIERAKARAFKLRMESMEMAGINSHDNFARERLIRLEEHIAEIQKQLRDAGTDYDERALLNMELQHDEEDYYHVVSTLRSAQKEDRKMAHDDVCTLEAIQRILEREEAALLEYFLGEERSYLIFLTSRTADLFILSARTELERSLRGFLKMLSASAIDSRAGYLASERIAKQLAPFEWAGTLDEVRSLLIIPDGILHELPFEALRICDDGKWKYLIERYAVSYCPSSSSLNALDRIPENLIWRNDLLAVGGADYETAHAIGNEEGADPGPSINRPPSNSRENLGALPHSRAEILGLAKLFSVERAKILMGKTASEEIFKALPLEDFKIIHIACHGLLDESHPLRSALALSPSPGGESDGLLQVREIYGLKIKSDLVVLSACRTARGTLESTEGPMGLARAFFFAGARNVLATLWPLNDKASVVLVREFYRCYLQGQSARESLRSAKLKMLGTPWAHPYYWASLTLYGASKSHSPAL